jgi:endonuclease G
MKSELFSDPKMRKEFLDRFPELKKDSIARFIRLAGERDDEEYKEVLKYSMDNTKRIIDEIAEGRDVSIPKVLELIIRKFGRPAYLVQEDSFDTNNTPSTSELVDEQVNNAKKVIETAIPSVGRINLRNHRHPWVGSAWVVEENVIVTNRHVASEFAEREGDAFVFIKGPNGRTAKAQLDTVQEYNSPKEKIYRLRKVLWIAPPSGPHDVAFLSIDEESLDDDKQPVPIDLMDRVTFEDIRVDSWIAVIGYPALSPYDDLRDQQRIFDGIYNIKRMQPGQIKAIPRDKGIVKHDATTLTGNSGSVVLDLTSGKAMALHFGGTPGANKTNNAVTAPIIRELLRKHVHGQADFPSPPQISNESDTYRKKYCESTGSTATLKIPLEVSVTVKMPEMISSTSSTPSASATAEEGLFGDQPLISLDKLTEMFSLPSLAEKEFNWHTALSLAAASSLAYRNRAVVERTAKNWGFTDCKFIDIEETQCFISFSASSVLVSFRGTESLGDWLGNLDIFSTQKEYGAVHEGFYNGFADVKEIIEQELNRRSLGQIWLTGHSLGGALATVAAAEWNRYPISGVYTFGQPAVGKGRKFSTFFSTNYRNNFFRFVNDDDIVTRIPPTYQHIGELYHFDAPGGLKTRTEAMSGTAANDVKPNMMSEKEFDNFQSSLTRWVGQGTTITEALKDPVSEVFFPSISDHKLSEYIRKIKNNTA